MNILYRISTHPQPLPARREGSLLPRHAPVNKVVTYKSAAPLPFQGRGWGWVDWMLTIIIYFSEWALILFQIRFVFG